MRTRTWVVTLAVLAAAVPARADTPKSVEPTVVVRLKSFDGLMADAKYLAELAGQADKAKEIDGVIQALAGPKGLAGTGLDTKRPLAAYAVVGPNGVDSKAVLMLPVADEAAFVEAVNTLLGQFGATMKRDGDGVHTVTIPNAPVSAYVRFANRYAYVAAPDRTAIEPDHLLPPTAQWLGSDGAELIGVTVNIDRIPDSLKQVALGQLQVHIANAKDRKEPNETAAQTRLKGQVLDAVFQRVQAVLTEGSALQAGLTIDRRTETVAGQLSLTGKPGSELVRGLADLAGRQTAFGGVSAAAAQLALSVALPDAFRESFSAVVEEGIAEGIKKQGDATKREVAQKLWSALAPTIKAGVLDVSAGLNGPNTSGHYTAFAAVKVQDGKAIERTLKDLSTRIPEKERHALKLDAETIAGVAVHRIEPGDKVDPEARRVFGDQVAALVAFRTDAALFVLGGEDAKATMRSLVESKPAKAGAVLEVRGSVGRLAALDKEKGAEAKKIAEEVFGTGGKDVVRFSVEGGSALTVRVTMKTDIIRFGSRLSDR
jgi:hypothetical protein